MVVTSFSLTEKGSHHVGGVFHSALHRRSAPPLLDQRGDRGLCRLAGWAPLFGPVYLEADPLVFAFGEFACARGATSIGELPAHVDAFVEDRVARHHDRTGSPLAVSIAAGVYCGNYRASERGGSAALVGMVVAPAASATTPFTAGLVRRSPRWVLTGVRPQRGHFVSPTPVGSGQCSPSRKK